MTKLNDEIRSLVCNQSNNANSPKNYGRNAEDDKVGHCDVLEAFFRVRAFFCSQEIMFDTQRTAVFFLTGYSIILI